MSRTPDESEAGQIDGVEVLALPTFEDDRGAVYRMMRSTDPHYRGFGEVYFSSVYPGVVKAWKLHRSLTASYACIHGRIRMVIYDPRPNSGSSGRVAAVEMSPDGDYKLVVVPPGVWNGFVGIADPVSILANVATEPHDPEELERLAPDAQEIPYRWKTNLQ